MEAAAEMVGVAERGRAEDEAKGVLDM